MPWHCPGPCRLYPTRRPPRRRPTARARHRLRPTPGLRTPPGLVGTPLSDDAHRRLVTVTSAPSIAAAAATAALDHRRRYQQPDQALSVHKWLLCEATAQRSSYVDRHEEVPKADPLPCGVASLLSECDRCNCSGLGTRRQSPELREVGRGRSWWYGVRACPEG